MSDIKLSVYKGKDWTDKDGNERKGTFQLSISNKKELTKDDSHWEAGEMVGLGLKDTMDIKVVFPAQVREIKYKDKKTKKEKSFETISMVANWLDIPDCHHEHQNEYGSVTFTFNGSARMKEITTDLEPTMCYRIGVEVVKSQDGNTFKCITFTPIEDPTKSEDEEEEKEEFKEEEKEEEKKSGAEIDEELDDIW